MISVFNPDSDLITVAAIEGALVARACTKVGPCTKSGCLWRAPNGRHFTAPNPDTYKLVPPDTLERVLGLLEKVLALPGRDSKESAAE